MLMVEYSTLREEISITESGSWSLTTYWEDATAEIRIVSKCVHSSSCSCNVIFSMAYRGLKSPVGFLGLCYRLTTPFDHQMS